MNRRDRDAEFVEFVAEHRPGLVRAARLLTAGDDAGAEDLVQATLTRLYVAWPKVRRADSVAAYARRSLTNTFIDEGRRAWRRAERATAEPPATTLADPARGTDVRHTVLGALAQLPPRQRAVVVLRHWLDLDTSETAAILECSTGTVKSQNAKALTRLRSLLPPTIVEELP